MLQLILLSLMLLGAPSYTDTPLDTRASSLLVRDVSCRPSDEPAYCHCVWKTYDLTEGTYTEDARWVPIEPRVPTCERLPMALALYDQAPPQLQDGMDDVPSVAQEVCDLAIDDVHVDTVYACKRTKVDVEVPVHVVTQKNLAWFAWRLVYRNTQEVPMWIDIDVHRSVLIIHSDAAPMGRFDLALQISLAGCSVTTLFPLTIAAKTCPYVPWISRNGYVQISVAAFNTAICVACASLLYTTSQVKWWHQVPWSTRTMFIVSTIVTTVFSWAVLNLLILDITHRDPPCC